MGFVKEYKYWFDGADCKDFYDDHGNLETQHIDRYNPWTGEYTHTDVYNNHNRKIDSFVRN